MKPSDAQALFKDHSTKSLNKYRSESIEQRALRIGKELLIPAFPRKKEQKNVFTITTNLSHQSQKSHEPRSEEQLQRRIRMLEYELKRKLNDDSILRNIFKSRQTHEMNHIDLYLQLRSLEDKYTDLAQHEQQSRKNAQQYEQLLKEQEDLHLQNMEQLNACISEKQEQWEQQKDRLADQAEKYRLQSEEAKFLIQELKKKNNELIKKNRHLTEQLAIEKQSKNLQLIKFESECQKQVEGMKQALSTLTQKVAHLSAENEYLDSEKSSLEGQLLQLKDKNEELQIQICQLQQMTHSIAQKQEQLRKEQKEKYTSYYDKLRKEHEIQIELLIKEHEQALTKAKKESLESAQLNATLKESIKKLQRQVVHRNKQFEDFQKTVQHLEQQIHILASEKEKEIEVNAKLSRQSKELKFERQQISQQLEKVRFELKDQAKIEQKLQMKSRALEEQNQQLTRKVEELRMAAEHSQAYRKLNDKIYNQNYKTLGRLIQISHKIKQHIQDISPGDPDLQDLLARKPNQQSLGDVVSTLAELLSYLLRWSQLLKKEGEDIVRQRNIENRQICNILQHCKNILHTEETLVLWSKYILHLKERKSLNSEQSKGRVDIYHQLIEHLINLHTNYYYSSEHHKPKFTKDSLDSTHLLRDYASKKKDSRPIERQSSCKVIKKQRIETEPPSYDLPLKRKLVAEEDDKENINLNVNKEEHQPSRKHANRYVEEVRQRISHKYPSRKRQQSQGLRSQVEKKYFRS